MRKAIIHFLWGTFGFVILLTVLGFTAIWFGWVGYMPAVEDLQNPINRFATQVFSADGKVMGTWNFNRENRICVSYNNLSPHLVHALVATEDSRFYEHSGIDFIALGRALVKRGILGQASAGGGSTITQQLAKQLYSETAHSTTERLWQKPIEWIIAVKLERNYTKEEIIALYLNYFDFLHMPSESKSPPTPILIRSLRICRLLNPPHSSDCARIRRFSILSAIPNAVRRAAMWSWPRWRRRDICRMRNIRNIRKSR